jgi:exosome complex component RRP43
MSVAANQSKILQPQVGVAKQAPQSDALRAQIFQRLHPHAYLDRFLAEGVRPDGREPSEWRDVFVNVGVFFSLGPLSRRMTPVRGV